MAVGGLSGYLMFSLSARDPRTVLPDRWRPRIAFLTALLCGLVAWRTGWAWQLPVFFLLPVFGVLLGAVDLRTRLLPNALVLPFLSTTLALLVPIALFEREWPALIGSLAGGAAMFGIYLTMALVSPGKIGMGDVKLAGVLGLIGALPGLTAWTVTVLGGFILGGALGVILLITGHSRQAAFPYGPAMLAAAIGAVLVWS